MSEIIEKVRPVRVDMICPHCGNGRMRSNGRALMTAPPQYSHQCNVCGYVEAYRVSYPYIVWEDDDGVL